MPMEALSAINRVFQLDRDSVPGEVICKSHKFLTYQVRPAIDLVL